ncbi:MAG TPA: ArsA family ATPase [Miltoncostaeaceae bacterium]|nr:ArsA family ATPase [Miltoncostaeaceae bacterium]
MINGTVPGPPLWDRRLRFVLGKGGVGKSTVSAALGLAEARAGKRVLVIEVAGQHRVARLFGAAEVHGEQAVELAPGLSVVSIDPERATEEYLAGQLKVRPVVEMLTRSKAFHTFAAAAPGLPELVTVGKVWSLAIALDEEGAPAWDVLVVDCPATGHGVAMLETAANVEEMVGQGPIADQAARIHEVVSHPAATGIVVVARPEELAVSEAVEAVGILRADGLPVAATVLNGVRDARFAPEERDALAAVAATGSTAVRAAAEAALRHLGHEEDDAAYRERLADAGVPVLTLPEVVLRRFDVEALEVLAGHLAAGAGATAPAA